MGYKSLEDAIAEQLYTLKLLPQLLNIYFCPDLEGKHCWLASKAVDDAKSRPPLNSFQAFSPSPLHGSIRRQTADRGKRGVECGASPIHTAWAAKWTGTFKKPQPGRIHAAIVNLYGENQPEECLYVGERIEDFQAAAAAGIKFMWVVDWKNQTKML